MERNYFIALLLSDKRNALRQNLSWIILYIYSRCYANCRERSRRFGRRKLENSCVSICPVISSFFRLTIALRSYIFRSTISSLVPNNLCVFQFFHHFANINIDPFPITFPSITHSCDYFLVYRLFFFFFLKIAKNQSYKNTQLLYDTFACDTNWRYYELSKK